MHVFLKYHRNASDCNLYIGPLPLRRPSQFAHQIASLGGHHRLQTWKAITAAHFILGPFGACFGAQFNCCGALWGGSRTIGHTMAPGPFYWAEPILSEHMTLIHRASRPSKTMVYTSILCTGQQACRNSGPPCEVMLCQMKTKVHAIAVGSLTKAMQTTRKTMLSHNNYL